jgi:hypothetical protein
MAAHPETLKVIQTVHDTVRVAAHDTIVRVAEPLHEHAGSAGFFGAMSPFEITVAYITLATSVLAGVVAVVAIRAYRDARTKARHHVRIHIAIARQWVQGPSLVGPPTGWSPGDVTPARALAWRHPRNQQVPLFSAGPLSQVTLLQNVFLPESLTDHLATVAQSVEAFNDAIALYNAFKMSDPIIYVRVERKLDAARTTRFPEGVPENLTQADLDALLASANLTEDEAAWCDTLFHMLVHAHVTFIGGGPERRPALFQRVLALEAEFARTSGIQGR